MDVELVHDPGHPGVAAVVLEEIASQGEHQLSSNRLVAVHVGHPLDLSPQLDSGQFA